MATRLSWLALLGVVGATSCAQQPKAITDTKAITGTVVGTTPGSAIAQRLALVQVQPPAPSCDTSANNAGPALPAMIFSRMMGDLVCERQPDGSSNKLLTGAPFAAI